MTINITPEIQAAYLAYLDDLVDADITGRAIRRRDTYPFAGDEGCGLVDFAAGFQAASGAPAQAVQQPASKRFVFRAEHPFGPNVLDRQTGRWMSPDLVREMAGTLTAGDAGQDSQAGAAPAPQQPSERNDWKEAVLDHLAEACMDAPQDEPPYKIIGRLLDWHAAVATDPAVNGGFKLTPVAGDAGQDSQAGAAPAPQQPVARVRVHTTGGNAGLAWSALPVDGAPLMRDGDLLYATPTEAVQRQEKQQ